MTSVLPQIGQLNNLRRDPEPLHVPQFTYEGMDLASTLLDLSVRFVLNCPKEDISTASRLMFQVEEAYWFYEDFAREQNPELPPHSHPGFIKVLFEKVPLLKTLCSDHLKAYNEFREYKKGIPVRGVIVFNDKYDKVLMVSPYHRKSWGFPRGKINKGEDDKVCAIREVLEETGFDCSPYMDSNSYYVERMITGKNFRFYFAGGVPEDTVFETRTRKEIDEIRWFAIKDFKSSTAIHRSYFLVPQFLNQIVKYSRRKRGKNTDLSRKESEALKNILGVSDSTPKTIHNDVESAQQLLAMLKPPTSGSDHAAIPASHASSAEPAAPEDKPNAATNADRQILLSLLKDSTSPYVGGGNEQNNSQIQVEGAKQILALLKKEMSNQSSPRVAHETMSPPPLPPVSAPVLPPNSMLEQLVSSRKLHPTEKTLPRRRENVPRNKLLDILNSSSGSQTRLIDLLEPPKIDPAAAAPYSSIYEGGSSNPLMDLLDDDDVADNEPEKQKQPEQASTAELPISAVKETKVDSEGGNVLLSLLGGTSKAEAPVVAKTPPKKAEKQKRESPLKAPKQESVKPEFRKSVKNQSELTEFVPRKLAAATPAEVSTPNVTPSEVAPSKKAASQKGPSQKAASLKTPTKKSKKPQPIRMASSLQNIPRDQVKQFTGVESAKSSLSSLKPHMLRDFSYDPYFKGDDQLAPQHTEIEMDSSAKPPAASKSSGSSKKKKDIPTESETAATTQTQNTTSKNSKSEKRTTNDNSQSKSELERKVLPGGENTGADKREEAILNQTRNDKPSPKTLLGNPLLSLLNGNTASTAPETLQEQTNASSPASSLLDLLKST